MNEKVVDRRVKKTEKALRQGLATLLHKKNLKDISVRELTEVADLHRGTFYVHYRDIYDFYSQLEEEMIADVTRIFDKFSPQTLDGAPFPMILTLIEHMAENADMCQMMFSENGDKTFVQRLGNLIQQRLIRNWIAVSWSDDTQKLDYFGEYMVCGCIGVFRKWVNTGMEQSPAELAALIETMVKDGVYCLKGRRAGQ